MIQNLTLHLGWFLTTCTSQTSSYSEDKHFQKENTAALLIMSYLLQQHYRYLSSRKQNIHALLERNLLSIQCWTRTSQRLGNKHHLLFLLLFRLTVTFSASKEKMLAAEQHFPHDRCALSGDESSRQVF